MKAALLCEARSPLSVEDVELDGPREGEVRIRVAASGLCHSDYHLMTGDLPIPVPAVLGHEVAGYVEAVGDHVPGLKVGDMVVTCFSSYCGHCGECQTGHNSRCTDKPKGPPREMGSRISWRGKPVYQLAGIGGFAEEVVAHHSSVVKISDRVPPAAAALLGCGVLTGAGAALNGARVRPGSSVVVVGCGGVGLNVIQGARIAGASQIIAVDLHPAKLQTARTFGATDGVLAGPTAVAEVKELTRGGVDYAFEVIGVPAAMRDAFLMLRMHGTLTIVGMAPTGSEFSVPALDILYKDARIIASGMGDAPFQLAIPQLARFYLDGQLKLDELVSRRIALNQINEGYDAMASGEVARNVVVF
ncbi:Zn-dependent alcohol dehydrogenase [Novosphingobium bradum]|uniref:Zn-dependent alcohol dehydrogenase n=1 Tax=Novosphingobium bradum TaxID=1737444 RepID=A0ABV7IJA1_9SPHN